MAFIVIYDANVLYPNTLRDLLIRIAQQPHLVQAKWINAQLIVTRNRKDFPEKALGQWGIRPKSPAKACRPPRRSR